LKKKRRRRRKRQRWNCQYYSLRSSYYN
jgi:hypothetical protein